MTWGSILWVAVQAHLVIVFKCVTYLYFFSRPSQVFPWILSNYLSDNIDLSNISNYRWIFADLLKRLILSCRSSPYCFRDLSRPIGIQVEKMEKLYRDRYVQWCDPSIPKFHYGSHYSTPSYVIFFLIRLEPCVVDFFSIFASFSNFACHRYAALHVHCFSIQSLGRTAPYVTSFPGPASERPFWCCGSSVSSHGRVVEGQHSEHGRCERAYSRILLSWWHVH